LNILGTNSFTGQYVEVVVTVPAVVGTYSSDALDAGVFGPGTGGIKAGTFMPATGAGSEGPNGTVTLATLTATEATGTFSFTATDVPFTVVTKGVFNVTF
jgi:hypothetical protein